MDRFNYLILRRYIIFSKYIENRADKYFNIIQRVWIQGNIYTASSIYKIMINKATQL